ncbi:MAG: hypothetical protein KDC98_21065 [Planctomycetes bacterium]|nr:hypothetical protein [Planctomycetota bacterium]
MRIPLLLCAAALLSPVAKADKFWLSDPQAKVAEGSAPDVLLGVLLEEDDNGYHIRVVGGEVILPRKRVFKIEKDDLSVDAIVKLETEDRARLAAVTERRALERATERLRRDARATEARAARNQAEAIEADKTEAATATATQPQPVFDPVIGRASDAAMMSRNELMRELQLAWTLTKDRRYLVALRKMRRMK